MSGLLSRRDKLVGRWNSWRLRVFGNKPPLGISLRAASLEDGLRTISLTPGCLDTGVYLGADGHFRKFVGDEELECPNATVLGHRFFPPAPTEEER